MKTEPLFQAQCTDECLTTWCGLKVQHPGECNDIRLSSHNDAKTPAGGPGITTAGAAGGPGITTAGAAVTSVIQGIVERDRVGKLWDAELAALQKFHGHPTPENLTAWVNAKEALAAAQPVNNGREPFSPGELFRNDSVCIECGAVVVHQVTHAGWHNKVADL